VTTDDGALVIVDPEGNVRGRHRAASSGALYVLAIASPAAADACRFITLACESQNLQGFDADANPLWQAALPFSPWRLVPAGDWAVAVADTGSAAAVDPSGKLVIGHGTAPAEARYLSLPDVGPAAIYTQGNSLICAELGGTVLWRYLSSVPCGPMAVSSAGIAVVFGRQLLWFATGAQ
jgi:hypothetical protein